MAVVVAVSAMAVVAAVGAGAAVSAMGRGRRPPGRVGAWAALSAMAVVAALSAIAVVEDVVAISAMAVAVITGVGRTVRRATSPSTYGFESSSLGGISHPTAYSSSVFFLLSLMAAPFHNPSEPAWLADLQFCHRTTDPYEEVFLPVFTGILLPPPDDPAFSRIPAVIPFEDDSPLALLNISTHMCVFCGNNHRDSDHETFAFKRKQRLNNKAQLSVAQLQQTNAPPAPTPLCLSLVYCATAPLPWHAPSLCPPLSPPPMPPLHHPSSNQVAATPSPLAFTDTLPLPPPPQHCPVPPQGSLPAPVLAFLSHHGRIRPPAPAHFALSPPLPPRQPLGLQRFHPLPGSLVTASTPFPSMSPLTSLNAPALPPRYLACSPLLSPPTLLPPGQILGARPDPDAFRKDPGFLFIGLDTDVEPWTCVLCNFTCGPALDSAMAHMASEAHTSNLRAAAKGPAAKEKYSNWRALTFLTTPQIASFLSQ
ncbi:unnamed protein product [Closterium sp. Naga37s-1]|nr:unnamed protein product [Closterium sp. Naga37s-1]